MKEDFEVDDNGLPVFDTEQEFQDYLERKFEENGFTAIQEVSPHRSNYRVDLLLIHDEYGRIGVELKRLTGGSDAGKAHKQIVQQYSGKKYIGEPVHLWAFAPYMPKLQHEIMSETYDSRFQAGKIEVLQHFFQSYGIGFLNVHSSPYAQLRWGQTKEHSIPAFQMKDHLGEKERYEFDLESIRQRVSERLYPEREVF
jgi:hypothetical protein